MKYMEKIKVQVAIIAGLEIFALILLFALGLYSTAISLVVILIVNIMLVFWITYEMQNEKETQDITISKVLGSEAKGAFDFGKVGIIIYDDSYLATWISDFLISRNINLIGKKVTSFVEEINELFQGDIDTVTGEYDGNYYEITKKEEGHVLFVRDISRMTVLANKYEKESLVLGMIHMDNYADILAFEDEAKTSSINVNLRQPIFDWANSYGIVARRLKSDRFLLILNEEIYAKLLANKFDILAQTKNKAQEIDVAITLSMAFARGHCDVDSLDKTVTELLELAQSRGGDQVAVKAYGGSTKYYGGSSESKSSRSRVRVRVIAQALKGIIDDSEEVFITGHREMDFDCIGACMAISSLISAYDKKAYIVSGSGGLEYHVSEGMKLYGDELKKRHEFISDEDATKMYKKNSLVIVVDYHNPNQSGAPKLIEKAKRFVVIDHHRRTESFIEKPLLVYLESGASSTCELTTELVVQQPQPVNINEYEAMFMYTGILIDTSRFKVHTGSRTFDACSRLRNWGADMMEAENLLKEDYKEFREKTNVLKYSRVYHDNLLIACVDDKQIMNKSLMSMSANDMLEVKNIEASFVVARISDNETAISARSKGVVNVQLIMEQLNGGGHFTAAAVQKQGLNTLELKKQLESAIDAYLNEEDANYESDID